MTIYEKIVDIMCWDVWEGENADAAFARISNNLNALPSGEIIDISYAGGLQRWAEGLEVESEKELAKKVFRAMRKIIVDPVFNNKKTKDVFPPLSNLHTECSNYEKRGKLLAEAESIADIAWNQVICKKNTKERADKIFANPDPEKYRAAVKKIQHVYGYSNYDIEALRYFVCQIRNPDHDPSKNKSIYHWGKKKGTAKTTVAKVIVSIMNGDVLKNYNKYSSTVPVELQFGNHDIPKAALYECVLMDEATPKDSRKSYNIFKSKLTDSGCTYNPKYKSPIHLPCKRFYYFTSNDDVSDFIQDESERRLIAIHCEKTPKQLSEEEFYQLWVDFCTNCEPEKNWSEWYNSFHLVKGLANVNKEEIKNEIFLRYNELFPANPSNSYISAVQVAKALFKNEPNSEQKRDTREVMQEVFGEFRPKSNPSNYRVGDCRVFAVNYISDQEASEFEEVDKSTNAEVDDLPF